MSWRYVPARRVIDGEEMWDIREFYEDIPDSESGLAWTLDAVCASGESLDELRQDLMNMLADIEDPKGFLDLDGDKPGLQDLP